MCWIPQSEYEFISCGLYLVVLLHLCEQRFSDVLGAVNDAGVSLPHLSCITLFIFLSVSSCPSTVQYFGSCDASAAPHYVKVFNVSQCCDLKTKTFSPLSLSFSTWRELYMNTWTILKVRYDFCLFWYCTIKPLNLVSSFIYL